MAAPDFQFPKIVCAPMAGGPSTVELAAAVGDAGGLGFLAAGYLTPDAVAAQIAELRSCSTAPFGVNVFVVREVDVDQHALGNYIASIEPDARLLRSEVGRPSFDDDGFDEKIELLLRERVPVVSFTF